MCFSFSKEVSLKYVKVRFQNCSSGLKTCKCVFSIAVRECAPVFLFIGGIPSRERAHDLHSLRREGKKERARGLEPRRNEPEGGRRPRAARGDGAVLRRLLLAVPPLHDPPRRTWARYREYQSRATAGQQDEKRRLRAERQALQGGVKLPKSVVALGVLATVLAAGFSLFAFDFSGSMSARRLIFRLN